ncbi:MAG: NUDIX domain-containing protein [Candidatus Pacebacteria bacterium]|nr:NUDIX domain-containing protein [Candidatus Paceibacterota bacterium]
MKKGVNAVIINNQNRVLVLKRSPQAGSFPNLWNFPGGKVENNETLQDAVIRETKEEANLEVKPENNYFSIYYYPDGREKNAKIAVYAFKVKLISGIIRLDEEHNEFKWISRNSWTNLDYTKSCKATLKELFK